MLQMRGYSTGIFLIVLGLLGGCAREQEIVQPAPLPVVAQPLTPTQHWKRTVGCGVGPFFSRLQPAYHGDRVYVADRRGRVMALTMATGQPIWRIEVASAAKRNVLLASGVTVAEERLLLGSESGEVIALNAADGQLLWRTSVAGEVIIAPISHQQLALVHTNNGVLQALNRSDGTLRWLLNFDIPVLSLRGGSRPAVSAQAGIVVIGGKNGRVSAISLERGELLWQQQVTQPTGTTEIDRLTDVAAAPAVVDNVVITLGYHGSLTALSLYGGDVLWQRKVSSATDFLVDGQCLYIVDQDDSVVAMDLHDGRELWRQRALQHRQLTAPARYRDMLVVGDAQGYLHGLALDDGHFVAQHKVDKSGFYGAPVVAADRLLLQARNGVLYAVSYADSHSLVATDTK